MNRKKDKVIYYHRSKGSIKQKKSFIEFMENYNIPYEIITVGKIFPKEHIYHMLSLHGGDVEQLFSRTWKSEYPELKRLLLTNPKLSEVVQYISTHGHVLRSSIVTIPSKKRIFLGLKKYTVDEIYNIFVDKRMQKYRMMDLLARSAAVLGIAEEVEDK